MKPRAGSDIGLQKPINAIFGSTPSTKPSTTKQQNNHHISDTNSASKAVRSDVQAGILKKVVEVIDNKQAALSLSNETKTPVASVFKEEQSSSVSPNSDKAKEDTPLPPFALDPKTPDAKAVKFALAEDGNENEPTVTPTTTTTTTTTSDNTSNYLGKSIRKYFEGHGWFTGKVNSKNMVEDEDGLSGCLWNVTYQDGDTEELSEEDLLVYIDEFQKFSKPSTEVATPLTSSSSSTQATTKAAVKSAVSVSNKTKKSRGWCPEGWTIEERSNPADAKSKPGEIVKTWIAPDGTTFKTLKAAKKHDSEKSTGSDTVNEKIQQHDASEDDAGAKGKKRCIAEETGKPLSSFFANAKPKVHRSTHAMTPPAQERMVEEEEVCVVDATDAMQDDEENTTNTLTTQPLTNDTPAITEVPSASANEKEEWVQCDSCAKWRKLSLGMHATSLSESWNCSLNTWDITKNSCEMPQEFSDEEIDKESKKTLKKKEVVEKKPNTTKASISKSSTHKKKIVAKKALCPEAEEMMTKYRKELDKTTNDYECIMKLDAFTRAQDLKPTGEVNQEGGGMSDDDEVTSFGDTVLPADIEVVKQGVPWALQLILSEMTTNTAAGAADSTSSSTSEPQAEEATTSAVTASSLLTSGLTSPTFSLTFQKLVACFIQGSPAPLPLLVHQLKTFCDYQADQDEKEVENMTILQTGTSIDKASTEATNGLSEGVEEAANGSSMEPTQELDNIEQRKSTLSQRAILLRSITTDELTTKIPLIAERKCYGTSLRGNALLMLNQDISPFTHAKWEVINLDLISYATEAKKLIEVSKRERRRVGNFIKVWSKLCDIIEKQPFDKSKVEAEVNKLEKLNMEEKARLLKLAQAEAKEVEIKKALERKKTERLNKVLEQAEKDKEKTLAMELKQKEKDKEASEKVRIEREEAEKKKKQSMKFMGFFKPSANTVPLSTVTAMSCPVVTSPPIASKQSSSSSSSKRDDNTPSILKFGVTASTGTAILSNVQKSVGGASSLSAASPLLASSSSSSSSSLPPQARAFVTSLAYKNKEERLRNFNKTQHDEDVKGNMNLDELSLLFTNRLKNATLKPKQASSSSSSSSSSNIQSDKKRRARWTTAKVSVVTEVDSEAWGQSSSFVELKDKFFRNKMTLLQFQEDERPPYWGTWSKQSNRIKGRRPFVKDHSKLRHYGEVNHHSSSDGFQLNYEVDSEGEWEEEEPGEDLDNPDEDEEEGDDLDYADGWLRKDDELGSDEEDEEGRARYMDNSDEQPNPPSVEGPFLTCVDHAEASFPEHLSKYRAIPMPWVISSSTTTTTTTNTNTGVVDSIASSSSTTIDHKLGCFPMKLADSLKDSLAIYDIIQPKPPKVPKQPKMSSSSSPSSSSTIPTPTSSTLEGTPEPTAESAAAAFKAAACIVASLQAPPPSLTTTTTGEVDNVPDKEPPAKKPKAEPKMVTNLEHLAFLAGIVHQSQGWNSEKIITTFVAKYPEHSKVATKRTMSEIAVPPKGRGSWVLKPESLAKFGIEETLPVVQVTLPPTTTTQNSTPVAVDIVPKKLLTIAVASDVNTNTADASIKQLVNHNTVEVVATSFGTLGEDSTIPSTTTTATTTTATTSPHKSMKAKSPIKRPAPASMNIAGMFARMTSSSPVKKQKVVVSSPVIEDDTTKASTLLRMPHHSLMAATSVATETAVDGQTSIPEAERMVEKQTNRPINDDNLMRHIQSCEILNGN